MSKPIKIFPLYDLNELQINSFALSDINQAKVSKKWFHTKLFLDLPRLKLAVYRSTLKQLY